MVVPLIELDLLDLLSGIRSEERAEYKLWYTYKFWDTKVLELKIGM